MANKFLNYLYDQFLPSLNSQENTGFLSGVPAFQDTNLGGWSQENFVTPLGGSPLESPLSAQSQGQTLANQPTINTKVSSPLIPQGKAPQKKGSEQMLGMEPHTAEPRNGSSLSKIGNILSMIGATVQDVDPGSRGGGAVQRQLALQEQLAQGEDQRKHAKWEMGMKEKMFGLEGEKFGFEKNIKLRELALKQQELLNKKAGVLDPKDKLELESKYRQEVSPYTKQIMEVDAAYRKIKKVSAEPSAAGDMSLIYSYMKMIDPGSTVRESEFANAERAKAWFDKTGVPNAVRLGYEKARSGKGLLPEQRADFVTQAQNLYQGQYESYNNLVAPYKSLTDQAGLNFENVSLYKPIEQTTQTKTNVTPVGEPQNWTREQKVKFLQGA